MNDICFFQEATKPAKFISNVIYYLSVRAHPVRGSGHRALHGAAANTQSMSVRDAQEHSHSPCGHSGRHTGASQVRSVLQEASRGHSQRHESAS